MIRLAPLLLLLLTGCGSAPPIRFESVQTSPAVRERARQLEAFARDGWHLPLRPLIYLSNAETNGPLLPVQREREEALAIAQLDAVQEAYGRAAFDFYGLELSIEDGGRRRANLEGDDRLLRITLPAPTASGQVEPFDPEALLEVLGRSFSWDATGAWWRGERSDDLLAALRRDLTKLNALEDTLRLQCRGLELLSAALARRPEAQALTPSEHQFARGAQFRATFALHRVLNTVARWRHAAADAAFTLSPEASVVLFRARLIHDAYLSWLLDVVVGGRTATRFWSREFWHRNPLYTSLDAAVDLEVIALDDGVVGELPAGSVRALLSLRLRGDLRRYFDALDAGAPTLEGQLPGSEIEAELWEAWRRCDETRRVLDEHDLSSFSAWKELWDARIKGSVSYPFYSAVAVIGGLLGDTRLSLRDPAVQPQQLARLEETLRPGDIVVVRQDGFLSNALLPGFWTHALIYLGPREAWGELRLPEGHLLQDDPAVAEAWAGWATSHDGDGPPRVLEAISEGVVFSSLHHALAKDYVAVFRPRVPPTDLAAGLRRALSCWGRPYDFDFDFASDERLVCTELVYRAFDEELNFRVQVDAAQAPEPAVPGLLPVMGRLTMPANELTRYAVYMYDHPDPNPKTGYPGRRLELVRFLDRSGDFASEYVGAGGLEMLRASTGR
jgi:hypothetical protein